MDLLTNAIQSICAGVEDYEDGSHGRLLTAVRNIHAGILLLYKEALRRLSPNSSNEALVKAKISPTRDANGNVVFIGVGKKTVDVQQIKERFAELDITADWARFDRITEVRNDIEHYYTKADKKALESVISDAFVIIRDFMATALKEDPLALLGDETWEAMLKISAVYEAERAECEDILSKVDWKSEALKDGVLDLTCPSCSGSLLRPDGDYTAYTDSMGLQCRICGNVCNADDFVPRAIAHALEGDRYESFKDGGEEPYTSCPICGSEAYVMAEQQCAQCGESAEHTCQRCGNDIPASELHCSPLCGYSVSRTGGRGACSVPFSRSKRKFRFNVFSNQKWDQLSRSHAKDILVHWPDGHTTKGIERHIEDLKAMFVYAPDTRIKVHPVKFGSGEWTSVIGEMEGTFTKPMSTGGGKTIAPNRQVVQDPDVHSREMGERGDG